MIAFLTRDVIIASVYGLARDAGKASPKVGGTNRPTVTALSRLRRENRSPRARFA
jgi:hypothetical protein